MIKLIGISGRIGSGKDEVAKIIQSLTQNWQNKKFAAKLKLVASIMLNIPVEKFENQDFKRTFLPGDWATDIMLEGNIPAMRPMSIREFLQRLGSDAIRNGLHQDAWVNSLFSDWSIDQQWVISDCRFKNEFMAIKDRGGIVIRIERETGNESNHISETALDDCVFDYTISNNGTIEELAGKVETMLKEFQII